MKEDDLTKSGFLGAGENELLIQTDLGNDSSAMEFKNK